MTYEGNEIMSKSARIDDGPSKCETMPVKNGIFECINRMNYALDCVTENLYNVRAELEPVLTSDDTKNPCEDTCCGGSGNSPMYCAMELLIGRCDDLNRQVMNIGRRIDI